MSNLSIRAEYAIRKGYTIRDFVCTVQGQDTTLTCLTNPNQTRTLPLVEDFPVIHEGNLIESTDILLRPKQSTVISLEVLRKRMPEDADRLVVITSKRLKSLLK